MGSHLVKHGTSFLVQIEKDAAMSLGSCLEYSKALKQAAVIDSWSDLYLSCQPILFPNQIVWQVESYSLQGGSVTAKRTELSECMAQAL